MQLKSCPGEGTIVTIRLPVAGPQFVMGEDDNQELGPELGPELGTVIDMYRHQGERRNDWQNDEDNSQIREQKNAQTRKTA